MLRRSFLPIALSLPLLQTDPPPPGGPPATPPADPKPDEVKFDEKQQAKLNDLLAAERKSTEEAVTARLKAEADEAKRKADEEAQRKEQEEAGEFDKVKAGLEGDLQTVTGDRDTLKSENEALTTYFTTQYEAALKDLPDVIKAFAPAADASFTEKSAWLTKATEQAAKVSKSAPKGPSLLLPPTDLTTTTEEDTRAKAAMRPRL